MTLCRQQAVSRDARDTLDTMASTVVSAARHAPTCDECYSTEVTRAFPPRCAKCKARTHTSAEDRRQHAYQDFILDMLTNEGIIFSSVEAFTARNVVQELWWAEEYPERPRAVSGALAIRLANGALERQVVEDWDRVLPSQTPDTSGKAPDLGPGDVAVIFSWDWGGRHFCLEPNVVCLAAFLTAHPSARNWRDPARCHKCGAEDGEGEGQQKLLKIAITGRSDFPPGLYCEPCWEARPRDVPDACTECSYRDNTVYKYCDECHEKRRPEFEAEAKAFLVAFEAKKRARTDAGV